MGNKTIFTFVMLVALAAAAVAQTKVSGTTECGKPEKENSIEVGDRPNHAYTVNQGKCTWTKPLDFGGVTTKEDLLTQFVETTGDRTQGRGYVVLTLSNADKMEVRLQSSGTMKEGKVSSEGKWTIARGTGKVKGLKGTGSFKCSGTPEKTSCDVEGEYTEAAKAAKK